MEGGTKVMLAIEEHGETFGKRASYEFFQMSY